MRLIWVVLIWIVEIVSYFEVTTLLDYRPIEAVDDWAMIPYTIWLHRKPHVLTKIYFNFKRKNSFERTIFGFLEQIRMENIESKKRLDSKLQIVSICSIGNLP